MRAALLAWEACCLGAHYRVDHLSLARLSGCLPHSFVIMVPGMNLHTGLLFDNGRAQ